ncbi:MAG: hypothetical protein LDL41_10395 [Coleofasciculus sp. S288]|nr:hypothetical protein [Coleofasciculus sp. S288]
MAENNIIECPVCSKRTVVQPKANVYQCLACNFKRDFSKPSKPKSNIGFPLIATLAALLSLFILRAVYVFSNTPDMQQREVGSSTAPTPTQHRIY